jgi:hypothetical protein
MQTQRPILKDTQICQCNANKLKSLLEGQKCIQSSTGKKIGGWGVVTDLSHLTVLYL